MPTAVALTVAIPTYNRRDRVAALAADVARQLRPGDELVVSDDGSTDGTADALAAVAGVTVVRQPANLGMVGNWNYCLTAGTHDWVCLIHDDDHLRPGGLDAVRRTCAAAGRPALVAHGEWEDRSRFVDDALCYLAREPGPSAALWAEFCPSGVTLHRAVVDVVGRFDPAFAYSADMEFFARCCAAVPSYVILNPGVVEYVQHGDNHQVATWRRPDFLDQLRAVERAGVGHAALPPDAARGVLDRRLARDARHVLRTLRDRGDRADLRRFGRTLAAWPALGRRAAVAARLARWVGWFPPGLIR